MSLTDWWGTPLGRWSSTAPPPATLAPSSSAVPSEAELDFRDWSQTVARQPPSPAAGEGQRFHLEADASELPRSRASPRHAMPLERMPPIRSRLRKPKMLQPLPEERRSAVEQARRDGAEVRAARQEEAERLQDEMMAAKAVKAAIAAERAALRRGLRPKRNAVLREAQLVAQLGLHRDTAEVALAESLQRDRERTARETAAAARDDAARADAAATAARTESRLERRARRCSMDYGRFRGADSRTDQEGQQYHSTG